MIELKYSFAIFDLPYNVCFVVISQCAKKCLFVHRWVPSQHSPKFRQLLHVLNFKLQIRFIRPGNDRITFFLLQHGQKKFPYEIRGSFERHDGNLDFYSGNSLCFKYRFSSGRLARASVRLNTDVFALVYLQCNETYRWRKLAVFGRVKL